MTLGVGCHEAADHPLMGACARPETAGDKHDRRMGSSKVENTRSECRCMPKRETFVMASHSANCRDCPRHTSRPERRSREAGTIDAKSAKLQTETAGCSSAPRGRSADPC